jgi:hypothetical protein
MRSHAVRLPPFITTTWRTGPALHFYLEGTIFFFLSFLIVMFSPKINKMTFSRQHFWGHNESTVMRANKNLKNKKWRPPRTFDIFHSFEWMSRKLFCFLFAKSRAVPKAKHCAQINENLSFGGSKNNNNSPRWAHTHTLEKRNFYRTWASAKMTFYILHLLLSSFHGTRFYMMSFRYNLHKQLRWSWQQCGDLIGIN